VAGWIIALIASPLVRFFEEKVKIKRKAGSAFVIVAVIALVILILYLVGAKLVDEIMGLIGALPDIWDSAENDFADIGQNLSVIYNRFPADVQQSIMDVINQIGSYVGDLLGKIGTPTINAVGNFAKQVPSILIGPSASVHPISISNLWKISSVSVTVSTVPSMRERDTVSTYCPPSSLVSRSSAAWISPRRENPRTDVSPRS
jgi:predicted PurR-regulated permease PerM